jgi:hypothetical protein
MNCKIKVDFNPCGLKKLCKKFIAKILTFNYYSVQPTQQQNQPPSEQIVSAGQYLLLLKIIALKIAKMGKTRRRKEQEDKCEDRYSNGPEDR